ncbi:MAG: peptide ABC transporter substrate-binding protein, partial [Gammaproteobacteria bacterium]|nr:peptide ABC transporter substrate-binding protein [Gammaproteobacteria bacterium]
MSEKKEIKDLITRDAKSGKLGRRDFMRFAVAAGMTVPLASGLWTSEVAAATPKRGGKFRVAQHDGNTSDNLNPGQYVSFAMIALTHTFRSYLTQINPDQTLGGDLASEWSASPDAKNWTFKLHKSATWHSSGAKVKASDVIASLNHHRGEGNTSAAAAFLTDVKEIVDNGDHSITIKLGSPNADLPWIMPDYHLA